MQLAFSEEPIVVEYVPVMQFKHVSIEVAAADVEYVPIAQFKQEIGEVAAEAVEYVPGRQFRQNCLFGAP
jgi:hypothetical protein